jgi:acetyltransferase
MPPHWSHGNPIDVLGDAEPARYARAVRAVLSDPVTDGLLAIVTPQAMTDPTAIAREVAAIARGGDKPVLASWMGGDGVAAGRDVLRHAGIPAFEYPDDAARVFEYTWRHESNLRTLYETVTLPSEPPARATREKVETTLADRRRRGEILLSEQDSKELLAAYGIPCVETRVAASADEAVEHADAIGYPVAVKLHSRTVTHKAAVGGVRLNLRSPDDVRLAFTGIASTVRVHAGAEAFLGVSVQPMVADEGHELILGSNVDPQFGPVLLFGAGGRAAEQINDAVLALPPLNTSLARQLVERTRVGRAMAGTVDMTGLQQLLVRFSQLVAEQRLIREIEMNPVRITRDRMIGLDARVVLQPRDIPDDQLPNPAIRPYPSEYTWPLKTRDGRNLTIRPIRPDDEPLVARFQELLSDQSVRSRYGGILSRSYRTSHQRLIRSCFTDFDRQIALAAVYVDPTGQGELTAVARLIRVPTPGTAEFAIVVADAWQNCGIGTQLLQRLVDVAKAEKLTAVEGYVLPENGRMLRLCKRVGFKTTHSDLSDQWIVHAAL